MNASNLALATPLAATGGGGGGVTPSSSEPSKQDIIAALLVRGSVLMTCDGRACDVPAHLARPDLALRFGWSPTSGIQDMLLDRWAISGGLSFGGVLYHCVLPWEHVYAAQVDGERSVVSWPDSIPKREAPSRDALATVIAARAELAPRSKSRGHRGSHLRLVD